MTLLAHAAAGLAQAQPAAQPTPKLNPVAFTDVRITDTFWAPRRATNRAVTLRHALDQLETTGTIRNLELAAQGKREGFEGFVFQDSDVYKTIEAVSYSLATDPDPELDRRLDEVIAKVAAAQMKDGYLNSAYQIRKPDQRWTNLRDDHELYCAGHLFEAAAAHYQATGKRSLLNIATKFADHIAARFGPGKQMGYPGHPEIELALVKLWRVTGERKYFDLARFFVENRGTGFFAREHNTPEDRYDGTYWQDNVRIREHRNIVGHAVRAAYLFSGVVDVARETGDEGLLKTTNRVWRNTTTKRMYVTGGIGASGSNEGFTTDYDLPNLTAYQETCASIAMAMWNHRLNMLYGDSRYADVMETALYNGALAGVSLDGTKFFYVNPLASRGNHHRAEWFGCACCPPNIARTLSSLGGYAYATSNDALWVNLYIQGGVKTKVGRRSVELDVATDYPWDGSVRITVRPEQAGRFGLRLRVPAWAEGATVRVNGDSLASPVERGYMVVDRSWKSGDVVELALPMPVRRIASNPQVKPNVGRLALARGPLVYCLEGADHTAPVSKVVIPATAALAPEMRPDLLGGVVVLRGEGVSQPDVDWTGRLYEPEPALRTVSVTAIPYYAWDNRQPGEMEVWIPTTPPPSPAGGGPERSAKVTLSFVSGNAQPSGINDGEEPQSSGQHPALLCHWWPHKGGTEWAQYTWDKPQAIEAARVYWYDDTGSGECRPPASWRILYQDGETWKPVESPSEYRIEKDAWNEVTFKPVQARALRLEFEMQPGWAAGVHEWQVTPVEED